MSPYPAALITVLVLTCVLSTSSPAQLYLKLGAGYAAPLENEVLGSNTSFSFTTELDPESGYQVPHLLSEEQNVTGSYGAGPQFAGAVGYLFNSFLGVETSISYHHGKKYSFTDSDMDARLDDIISSSHQADLSFSRGVLLSVMVRLSYGEKSVQPYLMMGPSIGWITFYQDQDYTFIEDNEVAQTESSSTRFYGGSARGARATVGTDILIQRKVSVFIEVTAHAMRYRPNRSNITKLIVNGQDQLATLSVRDRQTVYVNSLIQDSEQPGPSPDTPSRERAFTIGLNSLSAVTGIRFTL